jgi:hypothetical protein
MQHDEWLLRRMLERIKSEKFDIIVTNRNIEDGSMGKFAQNRV